MIRVCVLILLVVVSAGCFARPVTDTTQVTVRNFSPEKIRAYKADPAFQYYTVNEPQSSSWHMFWIWLWSKIDNLINIPGAARTIRILGITVASALLVFFLMRLTGMGKGGLFGKKNTSDSLQYVTSDEDIHAINFNQALQQAIANGNYRLATRLLYLQSLKNLADRSLIHWQINKTNSTYVNEIQDQKLQTDFYRLTIAFEHNWYGNVSVPEHTFASVREAFDAFNKQLA